MTISREEFSKRIAVLSEVLQPDVYERVRRVSEGVFERKRRFDMEEFRAAWMAELKARPIDMPGFPNEADRLAGSAAMLLLLIGVAIALTLLA